jgi:SAM-dependent methyltransferase
MSTPLNSIVPFGRTFAEYQSFFKLTDEDLGKRILGAGDGPASFNAELTAKGGRVVSFDPIYEFTTQEIERRFNEIVDDIISKVKASPDDWVWTYQGSPEGLRERRVRAMKLFCEDFERGKAQGRYLAASLPKLPFPDKSFDLALSSHFLFLYSEQLDQKFHLDSLRELLRVAEEVRAFPLKSLMLKDSWHLEPIMRTLEAEGFKASLEKVPYEFQKGADQLLRIRA